MTLLMYEFLIAVPVVYQLFRRIPRVAAWIERER